MSRVSLIEKLYVKKNSALEFDYDKLWAPPILSIFNMEDLYELRNIATSLRYNGQIDKKYKMIDAVMRRRGFRFAHRGTNRCVYNFLENPTFVAKVALDRVGIGDNPAEFYNQRYLKPFCCKIFEVDPSGVLAFVERVNPISSREEFLSVSDDIFNMLITKVIGKYVVDDLGEEKFMNYGVRYNTMTGNTFGPVIIDFPYVYELDGQKLKCMQPIINPFTGIAEPCGGEIDYDAGLNKLICPKCGRTYNAKDLMKPSENNVLMYTDEVESNPHMRSRVIDQVTGKVLLDSGRQSDTYITEEDFMSMIDNEFKATEVVTETRWVKHDNNLKAKKRGFYNDLQQEYFNNMNKIKAEKDKRNKHTTKVAQSVDVNSVDIVTNTIDTTNTNTTEVVSENKVTSNEPEPIKAIEEAVLPEMTESIKNTIQDVGLTDEDVQKISETFTGLFKDSLDKITSDADAAEVQKISEEITKEDDMNISSDESKVEETSEDNDESDNNAETTEESDDSNDGADAYTIAYTIVNYNLDYDKLKEIYYGLDPDGYEMEKILVKDIRDFGIDLDEISLQIEQLGRIKSDNTESDDETEDSVDDSRNITDLKNEDSYYEDKYEERSKKKSNKRNKHNRHNRYDDDDMSKF